VTGGQTSGAAVAAHGARAERHREHARRLERFAHLLSVGRLLTFVAAVALLVAGARGAGAITAASGGALGLAFVALVIAHARLLEKLRDAEIRRDLHLRHIDRASNGWAAFPTDSGERLGGDHPYARDVDLVGPGSLVQRIDVTHTEAGLRTLCGWLGAPAAPEEIEARQEAVRELAPALDLRESLEAAGLSASGEGRLAVEPFLAFARRAPIMKSRLVAVVLFASPLALAALVGLALAGLVPHAAWAGYLTAQGLLALATARACHDAFDLVAARRGFVEAYKRMLVVAERAELSAPKLVALKQALQIDGAPPSRYLAALDLYAGLAEFRTQFPVHLVVNFLTLWDLQVLYRLERWNARIGPRIEAALDALGELEALSSLAGLAYVEPAATFPSVRAPGGGFEAEELGHPLIVAARRVTNSLALPGPGSALIVTGSNMAGKSTLLRAVGLNVALALAGGPVIARRLALPAVRLRASMRVDDDLQRGASYFHAELAKLRSVVAEADVAPPIFFLLDELLRGTNANARHLGARAVLAHLLDHGAMGLAATHDAALGALEEERPGAVRNVHFTDVMDGDEMMFDYRLREGVVRTSNALRLLAMAGIHVPDDDRSSAPGAGT
jgi:hypothetical protein